MYCTTDSYRANWYSRFLRYTNVTLFLWASPHLSLSKIKCPSEISSTTSLSHTRLLSQCPRHNNPKMSFVELAPHSLQMFSGTITQYHYNGLHTTTATRLCPLYSKPLFTATARSSGNFLLHQHQ